MAHETQVHLPDGPQLCLLVGGEWSVEVLGRAEKGECRHSLGNPGRERLVSPQHGVRLVLHIVNVVLGLFIDVVEGRSNKGVRESRTKAGTQVFPRLAVDES